MALTQEQQDEIALQEARDAGRRAHEFAIEQKRARLEAIRLAKETLLENDRNKLIESRGVSAADITAFADEIVSYINA
jgi:hypothetical protein